MRGGTTAMAAPAPTATRAKYLYCVIKDGRERSFSGVGAIGGGDGIHTVAFGELAAVVSDTSEARYDPSRENMLAHERVIEAVMRDGFTVLPVRFGTATLPGATDPTDAIRRRLLAGRQQELLALHREMEGKVELSLKALWRDEKAIYQELLAASPALRRARDDLLPRMEGPPEATHFARMQVGELVKRALERQREKEAQRLLARLRPIARRVRENKLLLDRMVLNAAFLVEQAREGEFDRAVGKLQEELAARMTFRYTGPAPPFNFCELVVTWEEE